MPETLEQSGVIIAADQTLIDLLAACPNSWQGDYGFQNWVKTVYQATPPPAPAITVLSPATGPANTDITVNITGTGFDSRATVNIGTAFGLIPSSVTPTDLSVLVQAVNIAQAGTLAMSVTNGDGQVSNSLDFTVT
jgi:IPT/TIG domain-containing protein